MLRVGDTAPGEARIWTTPRERASIADLVGGGPILLVFYLFDWSAT